MIFTTIKYSVDEGIKVHRNIAYQVSSDCHFYLISTTIYQSVYESIKVHTSIAYQLDSNCQWYLVLTTIYSQRYVSKFINVKDIGLFLTVTKASPLYISWFLVICSIRYVYIDKREVFIRLLPFIYLWISLRFIMS